MLAIDVSWVVCTSSGFRAPREEFSRQQGTLTAPVGKILPLRGAVGLAYRDVMKGHGSDAAVASLLAWRQDGTIRIESAKAVMAHPRFGDASRAFAANMLRVCASDRALDAVCKDSGRYVGAMLALYLHINGGLTLARLKELGAGTSYMSPGRARSLLHHLEYLGYLAPATRDSWHDAAGYLPTAAYLDAWRAQLHAALDAVCHLEPAARLVTERLNQPRVFENICRSQGEGWIAATAARAHPDSAFLHVFMDRLAGNQILWFLIAAGDIDTFPPRRVGGVSATGLAKRFSVSRQHVRRLFRAGLDKGLVSYDPDGHLVLEEGMRKTFAVLWAMQMVQLLAGAADTVARFGLAEQRA